MKEWFFLDDERFPVEGNDISWIKIFRDAASMIEYIKIYGLPDGISFDHDLGPTDETGYWAAKEILEMVLDDHDPLQVPQNFEFYVHSQNPIGAKNIKLMMLDVCQFKKGE